MAVDHRELRRCLGRFATGVAVVSWASDEGPRGITVNSFTSVSLHPPLVLVSIARSARAHDALRDQPFVVNVLSAEQVALAWQFAGRPQGVAVSWEQNAIGPTLPGALAVIGCRPWRSVEAGDHTLCLGEVVDFSYRVGDGLGFFSGEMVVVPRPGSAFQWACS